MHNTHGDPLGKIFTATPLGMALLDQQGRVVQTNPALDKLLQALPRQLLGHHMEQRLHPQDRGHFNYSLERAGRERTDLPCAEVRLAQEDGNYLWARLSISPLSLDSHAINYFLIRLEPPRVSAERAEQIHMLNFALDYTTDGVLLLDEKLCIRYLNVAAGHLLGQSSERLIGKTISQALVPLSHHSDEAMHEVIDNQRTLSMELSHPADSTRYQVSVQFNRFRYERRSYSLALIRDLTEQQRMAKALLQNERQFSALIENTPDAIGTLTPDFRLIYANPALEALCRLPLVEARGRSARDAFGDNSQVEIMAELVREVVRSGKTIEEELIHGIDAPADQQHHYLVQLVPQRSSNGDITSVLSMARDITGIRKAERRLAESNRQLRELVTRRESAREEERKVIAQEVHDELGQHLTALRMGISMLRLQFGETTTGLNERVEHLMGLCDRTIQVVRSVATSLRPAALNMGLYTALQWLIGEFRQHTQIDCELTTHSEEPSLCDANATAAFRIVQEALNNVARHSGASRAIVSLERVEDFYRLDITDNGCGFEPASVNKLSLGLAGMRERGLSLGGEVVIFSHPGQGTTVQATFPANATQEPV